MFISDRLGPGGLVYVSNNAIPGWGAAAPMRRFFVDTAPRLEGDLVEGARQIIAMLVRTGPSNSSGFLVALASGDEASAEIRVFSTVRRNEA